MSRCRTFLFFLVPSKRQVFWPFVFGEKKWTKLRTIEFGRTVDYKTDIGDFEISTLAKNCPEIREIDLSVFKDARAFDGRTCTYSGPITEKTRLTKAGITEIAENCKHLEKIIFSSDIEVDDATIKAFAQNCPDLAEIKGLNNANNKISGNTLYRLVTACPRLTELDLTNVKISASAVRFLLMARPELKLSVTYILYQGFNNPDNNITEREKAELDRLGFKINWKVK